MNKPGARWIFKRNAIWGIDWHRGYTTTRQVSVLYRHPPQQFFAAHCKTLQKLASPRSPQLRSYTGGHARLPCESI